MIFPSAILIGLALVSVGAFAKPAPPNPVSCTISAFPTTPAHGLPAIAFHPQVLTLESTQISVSREWILSDVELAKTSRDFYGAWILSPLGNLTARERLIYISHTERSNGKVSLKLDRFPSDEKRSAGISADLRVEGAYTGQFLLPEEPESFSVQSPFRDSQKKILGFIHLDCRISSIRPSAQE